MRQTQRQNQKHSQKLKQSQSQVGALYETPVSLDFIEEEQEAEDKYQDELAEEKATELDFYDYELDESDNYDDMSGDLDFEHEEESDGTPVDFKNFPVVEVNDFGGELVFSFKSRRKDKSSTILLKAIRLIIETNKDFILRKTEKRNELAQKDLVLEDSKDKSAVSRVLQNNYFTFPDGISYCFGYFFSHKQGRKGEDAEGLRKFFQKIMAEENELASLRGPSLKLDDLFSDSRIAKRYTELFKKVTYKTIQRHRKFFGIGSIDERHKKYLNQP